MAVTVTEALWFLPFVLPICAIVAYTDLSSMRITNKAVLALVIVFLAIGLIALPLPIYLSRLVQLGAVLLVGIILNAAGLVGAGDAKFAAAAAPYIALPDLRLVLVLFAACLLGAVAAHRLARATPLRRLAPDWKSWNTGRKFPMGLVLGGTLALYLTLGAGFGT